MNKIMDQIVRELKAPFKEDELEFKVGAVNHEKTMGLALCYVKARAIQNRLDKVVGFNNWQVSYREVQGGFLCSMSLRIGEEWIFKEDGAQITNYESIKGGVSSAFKRVASSGWGIGRYLYGIESQWYPICKRGKNYDFTINPSIDIVSKQESINLKTTLESKTPQDKLEKASMLKITFGKYTGKTLGEIYKIDTKYFQYLINQSRDINLVNACKYLETTGGIRP